jgi:DNA modification methylase
MNMTKQEYQQCCRRITKNLHGAEKAIETAQTSLFEVGEDLIKVHDSKGFRPPNDVYETFEDFVRARFDKTRQWADTLMKATLANRRAKKLTGAGFASVIFAYDCRELDDDRLAEAVYENNPELTRKLFKLGKAKKDQEREDRKKKRINAALKHGAAQMTPKHFDVWCKVVCDDAFHWMDTLPDNSVDLILTDPPWGKEYLDPDNPQMNYANRLGMAAKRLLKPKTGMMAVMCGTMTMPHWVELLRKHVPYRWTLNYIFDSQGKMVDEYHVVPSWRPVLLFGGNEHVLHTDVINLTKAANPEAIHDFLKVLPYDKEIHQWAQCRWGFLWLVQMLSLPQHFIIDPFCGLGSTLTGGIWSGAFDGFRIVHGCDSDEKFAKIAEATAKENYQVAIESGNVVVPKKM